jgi:carbonic anhydrase
MSCPNSTSPVNIPTIGTTCLLKCDFSHNYPSSLLNVTHNGDHLSFKMNSTKTDTVEYGNSTYDVEEFRIYMNSLHTYVGDKADAELIIIHRNNMGGEKLLVSVPMMMHGTANDTSIALDNVLSEVGKRANSNGSQTQVNLASFNLNNFIPKKPFIIYNGTLPFVPCDNNTKVNYVVFRKEDAIFMTPSSAELLWNILSRNTYSVQKDPVNGFFFNKNGPSTGTTSSEDIYIDCKPTGNDDEMIQVPTISAWSMSSDTINLSKIGAVIGVLLGMIIMYILIKILSFALSSMKSDSIVSGAGSVSGAGISSSVS